MDIYEEIVELRRQGRRGAVATITNVHGSIPSFQTAKMLVRDDGSIAGTIGGGCVDIAQPDLACAGGFPGWLDILALAKSYGVATIPHVWGSGIAVAAALHAVASIPPFPHTANPLPLLNEPVIVTASTIRSETNSSLNPAR